MDRKVCLAYGACGFEEAYFANRITYIIDENGKIEKVFPQVDPILHVVEVLQEL